MSEPAQRLMRLAFSSPKAFEREYVSNLVNAGAFVESAESFEPRESVRVEIALDFCGKAVRLDGEVVHIVTPEMASAGGTQGVAVQFSAAAHEVRQALAPLIEASGSFQQEPTDTGQRSAPRVPARVAASLQGPDGPIEAQTRNLSRSGVLLSVPGTDVPTGEFVELSLVHPVTARVMGVTGQVMRQVRNEGDVIALGIQFQSPSVSEAEFHKFIEEIQSAEHSRRLGGISGSIAELGPQNLLHMFGTSAQQGTLTLVQGQQEGVIGFERGVLRYARLGAATGMKALTRLLAWREGGFEFHGSLEPADTPEAPLPLEAAVLEAVCQLDELQQVDTRSLPPQAKLRLVDPGAFDADAPSKVQEAVVDLARAGFTVRRILEVIPEPDPEIYRAIIALLGEGVIAFGED